MSTPCHAVDRVVIRWQRRSQVVKARNKKRIGSNPTKDTICWKLHTSPVAISWVKNNRAVSQDHINHVLSLGVSYRWRNSRSFNLLVTLAFGTFHSTQSEGGPSVWSELKPTVRRIKIELMVINYRTSSMWRGPTVFIRHSMDTLQLIIQWLSSRTYAPRVLNMNWNSRSQCLISPRQALFRRNTAHIIRNGPTLS